MKLFCIFIVSSLLFNIYAEIPDSINVDQGNNLPAGAKLPLKLSLKEVPLNNDAFKNEIDYTMLAGMGAISLGVGVGVHIYQQNAWWKDQRVKFHTVNDFEYGLWIDKVGHLYATNLIAHLFSAGFEASNMDLERSAIYGSIAALAFEVYVEIEDGYARDWGFSWGDIGADVLGAAFPVAQYYYPFLKNFMFKFSYRPVAAGKTDPNTQQQNIIIDDYEGQKYWLSMRMKNLLPKAAANYWPAFLNIAVGFGVRDIHNYDRAQRELFIALDLDAEEIPLYGKGWQFIKNSLNFIHFPMPGVRITPDAAFFVFCF
jgi:hypothetical protein